MNFLEHSKQAMVIFRKFPKKAMKILQKPSINRGASAIGRPEAPISRVWGPHDPE